MGSYDQEITEDQHGGGKRAKIRNTVREKTVRRAEKKTCKSGFVKLRLEQKEPHPPETQRHPRPDYCLHHLSAGPLPQPIPILKTLKPRPR